MTLRRRLRLQLAVGIWNAWIGAAVVWLLGTSLCGAVDPLLGIVGWLGCGLFPFGAVEIALALHAQRSPTPRRWSRRLAVLQVGSILLGGIPSAVVGTAILLSPPDP